MQLLHATTPPGSEEPKKKKGFKDYIPSRGWQLFWGIFGSITTIAIYDNRRLSHIQDDLKTRASKAIAEQSSGILERPRKVIVCVMPGEWGKTWFETYFLMRPLWITRYGSQRNPGHLRAKVRKHVWEGKQQIPVTAPPPPPPFSILSPATWWAKKESPEEFQLRIMETILQTYHPEDGIIAIGPEAYREGTDDKAIEAYDAEVREAEKEYETGWVYPTLELRPENVDVLGGQGPIVGYIPAWNHVGWIGFGKRIVGWFNRREIGRTVGEVAYTICEDKKRRFDPSVDLFAGESDAVNSNEYEKGTEFAYGGGSKWEVWTDIDPAVSRRLQMYGKN
ncbi:hypothetical protein BDR26DRAFT_933070 [Obelidium mucronatum]|nr:hypothetical protein BDR26DRAFT_933070 [Obelidium mucronatum]